MTGRHRVQRDEPGIAASPQALQIGFAVQYGRLTTCEAYGEYVCRASAMDEEGAASRHALRHDSPMSHRPIYVRANPGPAARRDPVYHNAQCPKLGQRNLSRDVY